jgi:hypothetical protein
MPSISPASFPSDPTPYLSIAPALNFRASLGGELAITTYCHELAVKGGEKLLEVFGGKEKSLIMENDKGELTANMVRCFPSSCCRVSCSLIRYRRG